MKSYGKQCFGAKRLLAEKHLDIEAECRFRHVKNETEKFVFHCHEYYEIFIMTKGKALHQVNGKTDIVEPGTLIFIRKDDVHDYKRREVEKTLSSKRLTH